MEAGVASDDDGASARESSAWEKFARLSGRNECSEDRGI